MLAWSLLFWITNHSSQFYSTNDIFLQILSPETVIIPVYETHVTLHPLLLSARTLYATAVPCEFHSELSECFSFSPNANKKYPNEENQTYTSIEVNILCSFQLYRLVKITQSYNMPVLCTPIQSQFHYKVGWQIHANHINFYHCDDIAYSHSPRSVQRSLLTSEVTQSGSFCSGL